jgi:deoxycytidine triphosphate deaminase/addiction module HigA family antidote
MAADSQSNLAEDFDQGGDLTPGEHLRAEIERLGLDQVEVSLHTGVSRQTINNIVNGHQLISRTMAGKLGRLTHRSSDYWLRSSFPRTPSAPADAIDASYAEEVSARTLGAGVLVNHQIVRAVKDGTIVIDPFDENNVQLASIDLTLDDFVITPEGKKTDISDGQVFLLKSGRSVIASPMEWIEFPVDYVGRVGAMARLARTGLIISHGFQIDPGFKGNLTFCLFNAGEQDFELRSGGPIISLEIMRLNATPRVDAQALQQLAAAGDRQKVISFFRDGLCSRLIRNAIRAKAKVRLDGEGAIAGIPELGVEFKAPSADGALDAVTHGALGGLKLLRDHPDIARDEREKLAFFGEIAEQLQLNAVQAREAATCLGLPIENDDALMVKLRGGAKSLIYLPTKSATISLKKLAGQLREDPGDLILMLVGLRNYSEL